MMNIDKKIVWEGNYIRTVILNYKDASGKDRKWEAVERVNCNGIVVIIPVTRQGEFLMIRQFRPVLNNFVIEFPAGLNDKDESLVEAARRELVEETGYTTDDFVFLADGPISSGMSTEILTLFLARDAVPAPSRLMQRYSPDETESIEIIKTPVSKVYEKIEDFRKRGDLIDLKIYGFVEIAKKKIQDSESI
ncbi:MAG: hypothetical protein C0415_03110 [Thermodesulfovibrio sp.]|nr:hypothetical protein [Thermodesulfovibrio sp.]